MRSFIAVDIKNEKVEAVLDELKKVNADIKVVEPQNLHLTLKFLDEISEDAIEKINVVMQKSFKYFQPFNISLRGIGIFPSFEYMRVIWISINDGTKNLIEIQRSLDANLIAINFEPEIRFDPHLTIGRVKYQRGKEDLINFILKHKDDDFGNIVIDKVELKKSMLTPKGPIYSTIKKYDFKISY